MPFELAERTLQGVAPVASLTRRPAFGSRLRRDRIVCTFDIRLSHLSPCLGGLHRALLICSCAHTPTRRHLAMYISQMCGSQGQETSQACTCWKTK